MGDEVARVRLRDVREGCRIVAECRERGCDAPAWQEHLVRRLSGLVGAQVGIAGAMRSFAPGRRPESAAAPVRLGWASAEAERRWLEYAGTVPIEHTPEYSRLAGFAGAGVTVRRDWLWGRGEWYASRTYNEHHRTSGIDDYIMSIHAGPGRRVFTSLWLHRGVGERAFTRREVWLTRFVHGEVAALVGGALATPGEASPASLSPRLREVLDGLLAGDGEKQIAYDLGLSRATVHEYVGQIYRRFGVRSRGELLARFVGRGRPG